MNNHSLAVSYILSADELHSVVSEHASGNAVTNYVVVNSWDNVCTVFENLILKRDTGHFENEIPTYIIDILEVPNCLEIIKSAIWSVKPTINTSALNNYSPLPMLIVMHGAFPRAVTYTGSISTELGV